MDRIKIVYIDDAPDATLSKYLSECIQDNYEFESKDVEFKPSSEGYYSLINNVDVRSANIIFIDSRLFQNKDANMGKFTGEEFKIVLRKLYPFIEVVVITQNDIPEGYETLPKYHSGLAKNAEEYYSLIIPPVIKQALKRIEESRRIVQILEENCTWGRVLVEKIMESLNGYSNYDELKKEDIDKIVELFKQIQEKMND